MNRASTNFQRRLRKAILHWAETGDVKLEGFASENVQIMLKWSDRQWRAVAKKVAPDKLPLLAEGYRKWGRPNAALYRSVQA